MELFTKRRRSVNCRSGDGYVASEVSDCDRTWVYNSLEALQSHKVSRGRDTFLEDAVICLLLLLLYHYHWVPYNTYCSSLSARHILAETVFWSWIMHAYTMEKRSMSLLGNMVRKVLLLLLLTAKHIWQEFNLNFFLLTPPTWIPLKRHLQKSRHGSIVMLMTFPMMTGYFMTYY